MRQLNINGYFKQVFQRQQGLTLIELLLALFVFSILSFMAFKAVAFSSKTSSYLVEEYNRIFMLDKLFVLLGSDLQAAKSVVLHNQEEKNGQFILIEKLGYDNKAAVNFGSSLRLNCVSYNFNEKSKVSRNLASCGDNLSGKGSDGSISLRLSSSISDLTVESIVDGKNNILGLRVGLVDSQLGEFFRLFRLVSFDKAQVENQLK